MAAVIILHGPTRAGKSWQAAHLAAHHGYAHISSGNLLRATKDPAILAHVANGQLARSEDIERLVQQALAAVPADQTILLDGFPRKINELRQLESWLPPLDRTIEKVIELYIPPEESHARGTHRQRGDDDVAAVERKWQWYMTDTKEVLDYCEQQGWLRLVDGLGDREVVAERIEAVL